MRCANPGTRHPQITALQLPKLKAEATELIGAALHLIDHSDAGDVIPGSGGVRAALGCEGRGGARTDLTVDEKKEVRQVAAYLKGVQ
jgi:hypothetical protein